MNTSAGPKVETEPKPRRLTPRFQKLIKELREWREADHADAITLSRSDIVELVEGTATLTVWAGSNNDDLVAAARRVMGGLNHRIDAASKAGVPVPLFDGIADLHDALAAISTDQSQN
jgi:hypothetical protein